MGGIKDTLVPENFRPLDKEGENLASVQETHRVQKDRRGAKVFYEPQNNAGREFFGSLQ